MKLITNVRDIPAFNKDNVHVRNEEELLQKLNNIIQDGHSKLQIVTDFDHTLTRHKMDNGTVVQTSFGMFYGCPSIPKHFKDENNRLSSIYKPIEADAHMSIEEKSKHMLEWTQAARKLLKGMQFPKQELMESAQKIVGCFRKGTAELIEWSRIRQVPVLVFSAGLGEAVTAALTAAGFLLPNVKVVSNFLSLDREERVVGIKGAVIHTYNKNETALKGTEYYDLVRTRSNVLLLGDNIGDAGMADGMVPTRAVLKVAFLGHHESNLSNYLAHFDVVLLHEPSLDLVNDILRLVH